MKIRVALADDHPGLQAEVWRNLAGEFEIVGMFSDGEALLAAYDALQPDVVVTDVSMPLMDGFEVAAQLLRRGNPPVVFFTVHEDRAFVEEARSLGVRGYVLKRSAPPVLATAIRVAAGGAEYLCPELA